MKPCAGLPSPPAGVVVLCIDWAAGHWIDLTVTQKVAPHSVEVCLGTKLRRETAAGGMRLLWERGGVLACVAVGGLRQAKLSLTMARTGQSVTGVQRLCSDSNASEEAPPRCITL